MTASRPCLTPFQLTPQESRLNVILCGQPTKYVPFAQGKCGFSHMNVRLHAKNRPASIVVHTNTCTPPFICSSLLSSRHWQQILAATMPPKRPGSPSNAGPSDTKRQMTSGDVNPHLSLAITIADEDCDDPLRHLPAPISDGSSLRPVQIRPISVTNNRVTLTKEQWKAGVPWPKGGKRAYFQESARFNRPQTSQPTNLQDLVHQHEAKKNSRLSGVTFLNPYDDSKLSWVAGLVGFDNTHQLKTWLDRDGKHSSCTGFFSLD